MPRRPTAPISASRSRMSGLWTAPAEGDLSFLDNPKYLPLFAATGATACLVAPKFATQAPSGTACLITPEPYRAFARALLLFYPDALNPKGALTDGSHARR